MKARKRNRTDSLRPLSPTPAPESLQSTEEMVKPGLPRASWRRDWIMLAVILLVGICLRGLYLAEIVREPDFAHPALDPQFNDYWARAMVSGDWTPPPGYPDPQIRTTPHGRPPGYPYLLAFVYWLSGSSYLAPRLLQMALGLVNVILMFYFARALYGRVVGWIAAAFMATYWVFIHFEGELTYPSVVIFISLLLMHTLRLWARNPAPWRAFAAGVLLGVFALFRPNVVLLGPVLVLWYWWVLDGRTRFVPFVVASALTAIGTVCAIAPPLIRNYVVADDFVFLSSYGGVNLWAGNNANADCVTPKIPDLKRIAGFEDWTCFHYPLIVRGVARQLGKDHIKFSAASDYFYDKAVDFITHHPLKTLELGVKRALIFWGPIETTNDKVLHYAKKNSRLLHWLPGFPAVVALFVIGSILLYRDIRRGKSVLDTRPDPKLTALVYLFIFTYFASVMPYFVAGRYRVPVIPFTLLGGAYAVYRFGAWIAAKQYRQAAPWLIGVGAVYAVASIPIVSYRPDLAIWHHQRAKAFELSGQLDKAEAEVRTELTINPNYTEAHNYLGMLLVKEGRPDEAIAAYQNAVRLNANNDVALNNLGFELAKRGQTDEAIARYGRALGANPLLTLAHNNLGNLLLDRGEYGEAIAHFEEALRIDPLDQHAEYNLGNAYRDAGKPEEAIRYYLSAMERDPRNPDIPNNLGLTLARQGKSEDAIRYYEAALQLDPAYANAYNNRAYVRAKLGKTDEAVQDYQEAIRLNPRFTLAHNNLGRLLADQGKPDAAIDQFNQALSIDPKDKLAYLNLGDVLAAQGKPNEAIAQYRKALENDPKNPDIPNNLANALAHALQFDEAERCYKLALQINPNYLNALGNLGLLLAALNRTDEAVQLFNKALAIDPNYAPAREGFDRATGRRRDNAPSGR